MPKKAKKEVERLFQFLKQNGLDDIVVSGEALLYKKGPKVALGATIKAMQCCGKFQRWTPQHVRTEIRADFYPLARALGIPTQHYIFIV